ncbi:hypothetical protein ACA910_015399 [Epithemia clementina (nom. ined.)]
MMLPQYQQGYEMAKAFAAHELYKNKLKKQNKDKTAAVAVVRFPSAFAVSSTTMNNKKQPKREESSKTQNLEGPEEPPRSHPRSPSSSAVENTESLFEEHQEESNNNTTLTTTTTPVDVVPSDSSTTSPQDEEESSPSFFSARRNRTKSSSIANGSVGSSSKSSSSSSSFPHRSTPDRNLKSSSTRTKSSSSSILLMSSCAIVDQMRAQLEQQQCHDFRDQIQVELIQPLQNKREDLVQLQRNLQATLAVHSDRARARYTSHNEAGALLSMRRIERTIRELERLQASQEYVGQQIQRVTQVLATLSSSSALQKLLKNARSILQDCGTQVNVILEQEKEQQQAQERHNLKQMSGRCPDYLDRSTNERDDKDQLYEHSTNEDTTGEDHCHSRRMSPLASGDQLLLLEKLANSLHNPETIMVSSSNSASNDSIMDSR